MSDHHRWVEQAARRLPATTGRTVAAVALAFGASGALVALCIASLWAVPSVLSTPSDPAPLLVAAVLAAGAGLGAAVAAGPLWWLVVEHPGEPSWLRGGLVGAAVGVVAHPLMWSFAGVGWGLLALAVAGASSVGAVAAALPSALGVLVLFSVAGLVVTGIVTVPAAAATGVALAHVRSCAEEVGPRRSRGRHV